MESILKERVESLQAAFNSEELIQNVLGYVNNPKKMDEEFGTLFSYYLCTRDKKQDYSYDEIEYKLRLMRSASKQMIDQRYYFQAFNGFYEETFQKNGLDDISDLNTEIKKSMEILENEVGKTQYDEGGLSQGKWRSYLTGDPETAIKYALLYSPERLWSGPLGTNIVEKLNQMPIKIGEAKKDYMMKILSNRIAEKNNEQKKRILKAGNVVCEAYGTKRPRIAIIPESEIKDCKVECKINDVHDITLGELAEESNIWWTQYLMAGQEFQGGFGVAVLDKIMPNQFVTITVPDYYELIQIYAIQRGAGLGDLINSLTGEIIEKGPKLTELSEKYKNLSRQYRELLEQNQTEEKKHEK